MIFKSIFLLCLCVANKSQTCDSLHAHRSPRDSDKTPIITSEFPSISPPPALRHVTDVALWRLLEAGNHRGVNKGQWFKMKRGVGHSMSLRHIPEQVFPIEPGPGISGRLESGPIMGLLLEKTERRGVISSQRERWDALLREPQLVPGRSGSSTESISVPPPPAP